MNRPLNVVVVNSELPYPATAGNRIRTLNLLTRLARRHRIILVTHRNPRVEEDKRAVAFLAEHGIQSILVDRTLAPKSGLTYYAKLAANTLSRLPFSIRFHSSPELRDTIRELSKQRPIDLWQAESSLFMDALDVLNHGPKLLNAQNVESLIWQRSFEIEQHPFKRWYIKQQWQKYERFETRAFAAATRIVTVSKEDALLIRGRFGGDGVDVVDNGIDRSYFEAVRPDRDPMKILFLGSLDWRPNLDAVRLLLDRIFPVVQAAEPKARLSLVGRNPPEALIRRVRECPGIELHADVPDVRPYLAQSGVMVVPLRIGGGSRLKILESLATGLPVVSTRVGAEGLELAEGRHYLAADDPEAMASTLIACLRNPGPALTMAERSKNFVLDRYDWDKLSNHLEHIWLSCIVNQ